MTSLKRICTAAAAAIGMALSASAASAVEPRAAVAPETTTITGKSGLPSGPLMSKAPKVEKTVVAWRRGRRNRRRLGLGLGIAAGVGAAILLSRGARARHYRRCDRWEYRCYELGIRRACRKFHNRCAY